MSNSEHPSWAGRHAGKDELRNWVWTTLKNSGAAVGDPFGGISNFVGADKAADRLAELPIWKAAKVIKANPDAPQIPVRVRALRDGKVLYMAVPRLVQEKCFMELTAEDLNQRGIPLEAAGTWEGALKYGRPVAFEEMKPIDIAVTGCVAVTREGGRTGKGAGFADLEFGLLRTFGLIHPGTPIVTTVHPISVVDSERLPLEPHDTFLNWIITPDETIEVKTDRPQPFGIDWDQVKPDQFETIPILRKLRDQNKNK